MRTATATTTTTGATGNVVIYDGFTKEITNNQTTFITPTGVLNAYGLNVSSTITASGLISGNAGLTLPITTSPSGGLLIGNSNNTIGSSNSSYQYQNETYSVYRNNNSMGAISFFVGTSNPLLISSTGINANTGLNITTLSEKIVSGTIVTNAMTCDYSTGGMIKAAPLAMITAYFRPFLWEASSAFMLLSALEGTLFMALLFRFIFLSGSITKQIQFVRKNEILVFAFVFVLVFGFFVGFSSVLFNVLIRFKAPLLPFLLLFLASSNKWELNNAKEEEMAETSPLSPLKKN
jgi:hypothetical protein